MSENPRIEAARLFLKWRDALAKHRQIDSDQTRAREQEAYDALVDFVEENDLNYTEFDPRGE